MSDIITISNKEARQLTLLTQGLLSPYKDSLHAIERLSYVQIDTISVMQRAHHHVFYSRNKKYRQSDLDQMMLDKQVFEYWSHAAAYLPMRDFRFSLYQKEKHRNGAKHWHPRDPKMEKYVLDRISAEGALQSKDFEHPKSGGDPWYQWKPAKIALTNLFMDGALMIAERKNFQKIFDLTERVLPSTVNTTTPTLEEYVEHLILNAINAHGFVTIEEVCYLRKGVKVAAKKVIDQLSESKTIISLKVEGNDSIYYTTHKHLDQLSLLKVGKKVHILSPFDNVVIQRNRLKRIFDFDYQIECYVPEAKRKYGYYVLPILYEDRFVARMNGKADRKSGVFTVKNIWLEDKFNPSTSFNNKLSKEISDFAKFCGCEEVEMSAIAG